MTAPIPEGGTDAPGRRPARWLAVALVVLIVAMTLTFLAFTRDDGQTSPEGAAQAMVDAVQSGDLLAMYEQLPPGERTALKDSSIDLGAQLQRLGLLAPFDPRDVTGGDLQFRDLTWKTEELGKDVTAVDVVGGTFTAALPAGAAPPLTDHARSLLTKAGVTVDPGATTFSRDFAAEPLRVVAIREGGGWHISLAYTVAELLRQQAGVEKPEMGKGPPAIGADSPADAVRDFFRAYADGDPERVLTLLYPEEARAAYDYAPLFLPEAKDAAKLADEAKTFDVQLNQFKADASGSGPVRTVRVASYDVDIRDEIKKVHQVYDGRCLHTDMRITDDGAPFHTGDTCDGDWGSEDGQRRRDNPIANLAIFGGGVDMPTFVIIERNGRWFISPTRTVLDSLTATLRDVPADKLDVFADRLIASWKAGAGDGFSGTPLDGPPLPDDASDADRRTAKVSALIDACAALSPAAEAAEPLDSTVLACIQRLVDTEQVLVTELPARYVTHVKAPPG